MKIEYTVTRFLDHSPIELEQVQAASSARYVSFSQGSAVLLESLDQVMKNHTVLHHELPMTDWALSDSSA